mgnify:CR=1 FL=1
MKIRNKKGVELTLNTIVMMIIAIIALIVIISFFLTHYGGNIDFIFGLGDQALSGEVE